MCSLRPDTDLNILGHWLHSYVLFSCVDLWWCRSPSLLANSLQQVLHLKSFKSSCWVLKCTPRYCPLVKDFSQMSHEYNLLFSWNDATWCFKFQNSWNQFTKQLNWFHGKTHSTSTILLESSFISLHTVCSVHSVVMSEIFPHYNFFLKLIYSKALVKTLIWRNFFRKSRGELSNYHSTLWCGNYGIFGKNFVKLTVLLLSKVLKSWFDEIFLKRENLSFFHS